MSRVFRCYAEKKSGFDIEALRLLDDLRGHLGADGLLYVRILNRYDVEGISEEDYAAARTVVFSEPQCDNCYDESFPPPAGPHIIFAVESLPGQYDQRADSCAQCIQILTRKERPLARAARVYILGGEIDGETFAKIKAHIINPVESRDADIQKPATLSQSFPKPEPVPVLSGFTALTTTGLESVLTEYSLAMDLADLSFLQAYFRDEEGRDPTLTELRVLDTYWSDHCRHTTFHTQLEQCDIEDEQVSAAFSQYLAARREVYGEHEASRPVTLMDVASMGMKLLKKRGVLKNLDESEEINACTVKIRAEIDEKAEDWLLLFKNETHNHPTEIEPFGGAATCLGGAIRDPLSGRAYVYQAMRVTGSGDPRVPFSKTLPGKLPQRKITTTAAAGYSSYGNQIGLATGLVNEFYHPGYVAKRLEIGAVVGAVKQDCVVRLTPEPGDLVILLGGRTGRDGCGGATGSSKSHSSESLTACGSEVQKGNPPEERKLQRFFRNPGITRMIKRCNDFGAGGVSVAVGELADGLRINLDRVPKKYEGLDGTELAISESQERMAVVVAPGDAKAFIAGAAAENLEAVVIAEVTASPRMVMEHDGRVIVDISRKFLNSNGAPKKAAVSVPDRAIPVPAYPCPSGGPGEMLKKLVQSLSICSQRGLVERFDGSIGAASVLMPFGGVRQLTPAQVMAAKLPAPGETDDCSVMSYGFNPYYSEQNPFLGAVYAVTESLAKLAAAGCNIDGAYLTLQEYFERLRDVPERWGKPLSALLGAFSAQEGFGVAAIGGKDSMSGSFGELDVPPTLVSFAIAMQKASDVITPEFKRPGSPVYIFAAPYENDGMPAYAAIRDMWARVRGYAVDGKILSMWALTSGGAAEGIAKMSFGNCIGFTACESVDLYGMFTPNYGGIIAEAAEELPGGVLIGHTTDDGKISLCSSSVGISELAALWQAPLEDVFPVLAESGSETEKVSYDKREFSAPAIKSSKPKAVIPVFPGTNCEYDTARALTRAGGEAEIIVIRNLSQTALDESAAALERAVRSAQLLILPGGFSGGDEPEGSGKFIASFFRSPGLADAVHELLYKHDGLALGICNGFQALIKLGLVPFGEIRPMDSSCPTLTFNTIGRHQSRYVTTRVASVKSPWLSLCKVDELHTVPVSHGEGRFAADAETLGRLLKNGQIAFQYAGPDGTPSMYVGHNPNGSVMAIEGITSPDGRVLGKMAHTERAGVIIAKNIYGNKHQPLFEAGVAYFR